MFILPSVYIRGFAEDFKDIFLWVPTSQTEVIFRLLLNFSGEIDNIEVDLSFRTGNRFAQNVTPMEEWAF